MGNDPTQLATSGLNGLSALTVSLKGLACVWPDVLEGQEVQPRTAQYMLVVLSGGILQDETFLAMLEADKS